MMRSIANQLADLLKKKFNFDAHYFLRGGFWLTLGQVVITAFGLITTALFAYYLDEADYGVYKYLVGLAAIFSSFSLAGLGQAILQTAARAFHSFYRETIRINFKYSAGISVLGLGGFLYYFFNDNNILAVGCLLIAILQPLINTFQFVPTYLQGAGRFKESTLLHSVKTLFISGASIVTLLITSDVLWLFGIYMLSNMLANVVSHVLFKPKETSPLEKNIFAQYLSYAKHTSVRYLMLNATSRVDTVIVFTQLGAIELAMYAIAMVVPEQIKNTFKNISTLLLPKYAKRFSDPQITMGIPKRSLQFLGILSLISVTYILVAPFLYSLIFPKYESAIVLSQILALSFPAMIALIPTSVIETRLHEKALYALNVSSSLIMVVFSVLGVLFFGLLGAIIAKVLHRYTVAVISYVILYKNEFRINRH